MEALVLPSARCPSSPAGELAGSGQPGPGTSRPQAWPAHLAFPACQSSCSGKRTFSSHSIWTAAGIAMVRRELREGAVRGHGALLGWAEGLELGRPGRLGGASSSLTGDRVAVSTNRANQRGPGARLGPGAVNGGPRAKEENDSLRYAKCSVTGWGQGGPSGPAPNPCAPQSPSPSSVVRLVGGAPGEEDKAPTGLGESPKT